jgi:hypothetical protein
MNAQLEPIKTRNKIIKVQGKVIYNDSRKRIDIKKPVRDLFEDVEDGVLYTMEVCFSEEIAHQRLEELSKKNVVPIILYFMEGGKK